MIAGYSTAKEIAEKWGLNTRTVQIMCSDGRIPDAVKFGRDWAIPSDVEKPVDKRIVSGIYKNWRKKGIRKNNHVEKLYVQLDDDLKLKKKGY